tara:strand:+ start:20030 stop:20623 length:594 start_codon:yes stop_codon:yes gene_type:complete
MKVLFITSNRNKVVEANKTLSSLGFEVEQFLVGGLPPKFTEPQTSSIAEVSESKINQALELISGTEFNDHAILVEDSGLFIESLNDFPGVYSSYVSKTIGNKGIIDLLDDKSNRNAEYRAYTILHKKGVFFHALGVCSGLISTEIRGPNGFGYDPIFIPDFGEGRTFGEMEEYEKTEKSHRAKSLKILYDQLNRPSK